MLMAERPRRPDAPGGRRLEGQRSGSPPGDNPEAAASPEREPSHRPQRPEGTAAGGVGPEQTPAAPPRRAGPGDSAPGTGPPGPGRRRRNRQARERDAPLTPEAVIKKRRRRCSDAQAITGFFTKLVAIVVLLALLFSFAFGLKAMPSDDMSPRISAGDLMLYYRLAGEWAVGDVMVFEKDGEQYVGRVVARGGDTVEVTDQATLVVNGSTVLESDIYYTTPKYDNGPTYPLTLAEDEFFVLCDYREGARDSRYFGPVSADEVKGKVITVVRRSGL